MSGAKASDVLAAPEAPVVPVPANGEAPVLRFLTADEILAADDLGLEDVEVPEWSGWVTVRGMRGSERDSFEASMIEQRGKVRTSNLDNFRSKMVARCIVDRASGQRLFTDAQAVALGRKSAAALQRVYRVAERLSGFSDDEVDELTEALKDEPSADSGSD